MGTTKRKPVPRNKGQQGWFVVGGKRCFFRSRWERNYARHLEARKSAGEILDWSHEPKTFWFEAIKRGTRSYLPDFLVTEMDGSETYVEVKGWMDPKSKTKLKRMAKYHPDVVLELVGATEYRDLEKLLGKSIEGWEM